MIKGSGSEIEKDLRKSILFAFLARFRKSTWPTPTLRINHGFTKTLLRFSSSLLDTATNDA